MLKRRGTMWLVKSVHFKILHPFSGCISGFMYRFWNKSLHPEDILFKGSLFQQDNANIKLQYLKNLNKKIHYGCQSGFPTCHQLKIWYMKHEIQKYNKGSAKILRQVRMKNIFLSKLQQLITSIPKYLQRLVD